jgi:HPt (histidine-containing phosphotransfer) domain-containing protein
MTEPPFDPTRLEHLEQRLGAPTVAEIISEFLGHVPGKIEQVRKVQTPHDLDPAAGALHSIRSSAGLLGATRLATLAGEMEVLARTGDCDAFKGLCDDLSSVYAETEMFCRRQRQRLVP